MVTNLSHAFPLLLAAIILAASPEAGDAATTGGIRGRVHQEVDYIASSGDINAQRELKTRRKKKGKGKMKGNGKTKAKGKGKGKKKGGKKPLTSNGSTVDGRLDIPADTAAPAPTKPKLADWIDGCSTQNREVNSCAKNNFVCKHCLYALSVTSVTPSNGTQSVAACGRNDFCGDCALDDLMPFFDCGWGISNPVNDSASFPGFPDSSIRTPPPMNATDSNSTIAPVFDQSAYDTVNCPSVYPGSGIDCVMIDGYEFKKCIYYEVGADVMCECSEDDRVWDCSGTITNENFIIKTEDLEVEIEEEAEIAVLPAVDVVFSRIDGAGESGTGDYPAALLCPVNTPAMGDSCSTKDFVEIACCYEDPNPYPNTLGTVTCTCSDDGAAGFQCMGGSLSTCVL